MLADLIEKVEKLTGADREVDRQLWEVATGNKIEWARSDVFAPETVVTEVRYGPGAIGNPVYTLDPLTGTINAALAFAELKLPGCWYVLAKGRLTVTEPLYGCELLFGSDEQIGIASGHTQEGAIISATLRALTQLERAQ